METFLNITPQLALAAFMFYAFKWLLSHFDPHLIRLLDSIDDIRETGQRMADIGEHLLRIVEAQQDWQENLDVLLYERHKELLSRLEALEATITSLILKRGNVDGMDT